MTIYIVLLFVITLPAIQQSNYVDGTERKNRESKVFFYGLLIILILVQGLRSSTVGGDLYDNYARLYNSCGALSWGNVLTYSSLSGYEIGYVLLNKACFMISGGNLQFLLFVIAILYIGSVGRLLTILSNSKYVGLFIFFASYAYNISMNNLRSSVALSIIYFAIPYLINKKPMKFLISVVIASIFHTTALVFVFYFVAHIITNRKTLVILYSAVAGVFTVGFPMVGTFVGRYFDKFSRYFSGTSDGGLGFLVFLLFFVGVIIVFSHQNFWEDDVNISMFKMLLCATVLQFVSLRIPFFNRAVNYHFISLSILLPALLEKNRLEAKSKIILLFGMIIGFWIYYIVLLNANPTMTVPYSFYN